MLNSNPGAPNPDLYLREREDLVVLDKTEVQEVHQSLLFAAAMEEGKRPSLKQTRWGVPPNSTSDLLTDAEAPRALHASPLLDYAERVSGFPLSFR